ncbi:MAG: AAA family ATPase [Paracoccaceae bacterium]
MNRYGSDPFRRPEQPSPDGTPELDLRKLLAILRRNWRFMAFATLVGILLGVAQIATTTRLYTAAVDIDIGRSEDTVTFQDFAGVASTMPMIEIETELQVLRSEQIAERVVRALDLHQDRTFAITPETGVGRALGYMIGQAVRGVMMVRSLLTEEIAALPPPELTKEELENRAIEGAALRMRANMSVVNVRASRILQIRYTSASPILSARVANAIAQAYMDDKLQASDVAAQRAIDWLQQRRDQLREQTERLTQIAERFRANNNLIGVDLDRTTDPELDRLTQDLVAARTELIDLEARDRRLTEIVTNGDTTAVARETATQGITAELRSRYLEVLRSYNNLASSLGDDHEQTQRRLRELRDIEGLMFEEIRRSAQLIRDDIRATRERVTSLETAFAAASERTETDQTVLTELRQMERNAEAARTLFASFQQRLQEASQRQEIPTSQARFLNRARPPGGPSSPNAPRILVFSAVLSLLFAVSLVAYREWRDDRVRSEEQVREMLGLEYLGELPVIKGAAHTVPAHLLDLLDARKQTTHLPKIMTFAADKPLSNFAETLRTGKISLSLHQGKTDRTPKIGFVSCVPAEGKTTVAANFANLLAQQGARVLLIDGDMRNPGLTQSMGRPFDAGLVDVLLDKKDWREVLYTVEETGLHVIPNSKTRAVYTAELIGGSAMSQLLDQVEREYDFVLLDLPPLAAVVDARAVLDRLDGIFFVLKWGSTRLEMVNGVLRADSRLREKCLGMFLNMYEPKKAQAYGGGKNDRYYSAQYSRYYQDT